MIRKTLSLKPEERRTVVFMEPMDIMDVRSTKGADTKWLMEDPAICVIEYPPEAGSKILNEELYKKLASQSMVKENSVLIQKPYDVDGYELIRDKCDESELDTIFQSHALDKYHCFTEFCGLLGAKSVEIVDIEESKSGSSTSASASVGTVGWGASGSFLSLLQKAFGKEINLGMTFSAPTRKFEEAKFLLRKHRLEHDKCMTTLLSMAEKSHPGTYDVSFSAYEDTKTSLEIAAKVRYLAFNAEGSFKRNVESYTKKTIKIKIEFFD